MSFSLLVDVVAVKRDEYKNKYRELSEKRDKDLRELKNDYVGQRLEREISKVNAEFAANLADLKADFRENLRPQIEEIRTTELEKIKKIDTDTLSKLAAISDMEISQIEMNQLCEAYVGKSYFTDKALRTLAAKNGLIMPSTTAGADARLNVLAQLENQVETLLQDYDGTTDRQNILLCSDAILARLERRFDGKSEEGGNVTADAKAILHAIAEKKDSSDFEKGLMLKNSLADASAEVKEAMFGMIAANNARFSNTTIAAAGIKTEITARRQRGAQDAKKQAESIMQEISAPDARFGDVVTQLAKNRDNGFLVSAIRESGNAVLLKAARVADSKTYNITDSMIKASTSQTDGTGAGTPTE